MQAMKFSFFLHFCFTVSMIMCSLLALSHRLRCTHWQLIVVFLCFFFSACARLQADQVELKDGRILEGKFAQISGVAIDPIAQARSSDTAGTPILMCDDELTRTMVSQRNVQRVEPGAVGIGMERIPIPQKIAENGRRLASVGVILETTPFDNFGRRIFSVGSAAGRIDMVQGITMITPLWTSIEGLATEKSLILDMRLATSSIPRDVLRRVIDQNIDRTNPDHRLRVVRLYLQSDRYEDAKSELDEVLSDFPDLADLAVERRSLSQLAAKTIIDEILLRSSSGQDRMAMSMLENFPSDDIDGEVLEIVREKRDEYRNRRDEGRDLVAAISARAAELEDEDQRQSVLEMSGEIARELSFSSLDRLESFKQLGLKEDLSADRATALAVSGWLLGSDNASDNLIIALSSLRVRHMLCEYMTSVDKPSRASLLARLREEETFDAATVALLASNMKPPQPLPPQKDRGLYEIMVQGIQGDPPVRCLVQLPPEYDPLRKYPTVVTLHAAWSTPLNQIEWWAGMPGNDGSRLGQASRRGYIVVAPFWGQEHQTSYEYSAREHAAVLGSLREASRHFSIDSDRVFLSGHSMGGDAAWDVALSHPDLWAGLVGIVPTSARYVNHYWKNAHRLPMYLVGGELDSDRLVRNAMDLDRYFQKGFDATYVEYLGRGHEHFSDDIHRIFDWMGRKTRSFFPNSVEAVSMRPWDSFFWWIEMSRAPVRTIVLPAQWPPSSGVRALEISAKTTPGNSISVRCGAEKVTVWLSPDMIDFSKPLSVTIDGQRRWNGDFSADLEVMLEDLRTRGDRQHPFWAKIESVTRKSQ